MYSITILRQPQRRSTAPIMPVLFLVEITYVYEELVTLDYENLRNLFERTHALCHTVELLHMILFSSHSQNKKKVL